MGKISAEQIISELKLEPLPGEGGFFRQTWKTGAGTVIYYLVTPETWSSFHILTIDEVWHFYAGDPLKQLQLHPDGRADVYELGNNIAEGQLPQLICPAGVWQATRLVPGGEWALTGTSMAPPYTDECNRFPEPGEISDQFPLHLNLIKEFT